MSVETNKSINRYTVEGITCYCSEEFRDAWNNGDIDCDYYSLYVVVPTRSGDSNRLQDGEVVFQQGMGTSWEGSLGSAISAGVLAEDFGEGERIEAAV